MIAELFQAVGLLRAERIRLEMRQKKDSTHHSLEDKIWMFFQTPSKKTAGQNPREITKPKL